MAIDLLPVVSWIVQDSNASYTDTLRGIVSSFRPYAKALLVRYAPPDRSGCDPAALTHGALFAMQREILDQYLPPLEANRVRSVGCLWPWWKVEMKVMLKDGTVHKLSPLPDGNGLEHEYVIGGVPYRYTFYRNDSEQQRRKWLHEFLQEEARKEARGLGPRGEVQIPEHTDFADKWSVDSDSAIALREWCAITDQTDWRECLGGSRAADVAARKRRQRAKARLVAAYHLQRNPPTPETKRYLARLKEAEDGNRATILDDYLRRYGGRKEEDE